MIISQTKCASTGKFSNISRLEVIKVSVFGSMATQIILSCFVVILPNSSNKAGPLPTCMQLLNSSELYYGAQLLIISQEGILNFFFAEKKNSQYKEYSIYYHMI